LLGFILVFIARAGYAFNQDSRIAIVGTGASGLTAAHTLRERGYHNLTVFEKRDRVGGKVYSYPYQDTKFELGAFWAGEGYTITDQLAREYGVEFYDEEIQFLVRDASGQEWGLTQFVQESYSIWTLLGNLIAYQKVQHKFGDLLQPDGFFKVTHPDIYLPFGKFAEKYGIEAIAAGYRPFWIGCGYGYYDEVPAMYVLKLMLGSIKVNIWDALVALLPWSQNQEQGLRRAPEGYQEIWERLAASLPDVRLNSEVTAIRRYDDHGQTLIDVTANGQTETFDAVIVATDLGAAGQFLDIGTATQSLFNLVENYNYYIHLFDADIPTYTPGTMVFLDKYGESATIGHATALVNRDRYPRVWTSGQLAPWDADGNAIEQTLREDVTDLGGQWGGIIEQVQWTYFPHVKTQGLRAGFYPRLAKLQGVRNTFFVGGVLNFETVESTAAFAKHLIEKNFTVQN
jgi:hypothetical protein